MKTIKHTPGPWTAKRYKPTEPVQVWNQNTHIADLFSHSNESDKANANLISAAPDLLGALEFILSSPLTKLTPGETSRAQKAIAKATGGAQ